MPTARSRRRANRQAGRPGQDEGLAASWIDSGRRVPRMVRPLQAFLQTEYAGGIVLLVAAAIALVWANSPWSGSYERVWHTTLTVRVGGFSLSEDLRHWVNDALMTLFFFVVGLEIKRELVSGELRERRAAALPVVAALGGMVAPALLYLVFNRGGEELRGWGIPMATDIAFAVGVLSLVGRRLPGSLKAFLLALAIVDDIGAILVIALFYSGAIEWTALAVALAAVVVIQNLQRLRVTWTALYVVLGFVVWLGTLQSGVHATIAGVALGLMTPAFPFQRPRAVSEEARRIADDTEDHPDPPDADAHHWLRLGRLSRDAVSPLARLEHALHPYTSLVVIPVFALANAGVRLDAESLRAAAASSVTAGVVAGLVLGKPLGILAASWAAVRLRAARLPRGVTWAHLLGVGALAGIGFTVSLFITDLAFLRPGLAAAAKTGILGASVLAGVLGAILLAMVAARRSGEPPPAGGPPEEPVPAEEAEPAGAAEPVEGLERG